MLFALWRLVSTRLLNLSNEGLMAESVLTYMKQSRHGLARTVVENVLKTCGHSTEALNGPAMQALQGQLAASILMVACSGEEPEETEIEPDVADRPAPTGPGTSDSEVEVEERQPPPPLKKKK